MCRQLLWKHVHSKYTYKNHLEYSFKGEMWNVVVLKVGLSRLCYSDKQHMYCIAVSTGNTTLNYRTSAVTWIVVGSQSSTSPHDPFVQTPTASLPAPVLSPQCSQHMNIINCDSQRQGHSGLHSQTGTRCALMTPTLSREIPKLPRRNKPLMTGSVDLPGEDKRILTRWLSTMSAKQSPHHQTNRNLLCFQAWFKSIFNFLWVIRNTWLDTRIKEGSLNWLWCFKFESVSYFLHKMIYNRIKGALSFPYFKW